MTKDGILNSESRNRVDLAVSLFKDEGLELMITCGWDYRPDSSLYIGEILKNRAIELGIPANQIKTELNSRDTVGDAFFSKTNIINELEFKNILVVTSDYHVDRTRSIFEFIFGPKYKIHVEGAFTGYKNDKIEAEVVSAQAFRKTFTNVKSGEDKEIFTRLIESHPFYNGEVHQKINYQLKR